MPAQVQDGPSAPTSASLVTEDAEAELAAVPGCLTRRAKAAAALVGTAAHVVVAHHIDADGVSAGAVAAEALARAGISFETVACKSLDDAHIARLNERMTASSSLDPVLWLCDFGSTAYMRLPGNKVVCDHHELVRDGTEESFPHVNPLLDDLPGDSISGAGCAYLVAEAMDAANHDLRPLALVGATADLQDRRDGELHGCNAALLAAARAEGQVSVLVDLAWFGIETRDLGAFFRFCDPAIPGLADGRVAESLATDLAIPWTTPEGKVRTWNSLNEAEKYRFRSAVVDHALDVGWSPDDVGRLWRQVILFPNEEPQSPVREAQAFATLLNSTARYGKPEVGLAVAAGDRKASYQEALELLSGHRRHLVGAMQAFARHEMTNLQGIQWVHLERDVKDTVVGIACGMALGGGAHVRGDLALVGLAYADAGHTKVSGRAPQALQDAGIDLATAMREAASGVGGVGGGHKGAAGATIPTKDEQAFLQRLDSVVARQLNRL